MMRPSEIVDAHGELLARLQGADLQRFLHRAFLAEAEALYPQHADLASESAGVFTRGLTTAVALAECYRVTEDMVDLMIHAAESLDEDDLFDKDLAPTAGGIVRFEKPVSLGTQPDGTEVAADWLIWGPVRDQIDDGRARVASYWITDRRRHAIEYPEWADRIVGRWHVSGWDSTPQGRSMGPSVLVGPQIETAGGLLVGAEWDNDRPQMSDVRYVQALWLLLNQTVTVLRDEEIDRPARRRAGRMKIPARVTTVALRRSEYVGAKPEGESMVEWQHRWIVRGHWRWQACGVGRQDRKRIWVNPFVKGPEGAPLKQSSKLYDLRK